MKKLIKKVLPVGMMNILRDKKNEYKSKKIIKNDVNRFVKYSFKDTDPTTYEQLEARLTKEYHSIEKGLSYKELRLGFGKRVLDNVISLVEIYLSKGYPTDSHVYVTAINNLEEYIRVHEEFEFEVTELKKKVEKFKKNSDLLTGGVKWTSKEEMLEKSKSDFKEFSLSRHSVRDYSEKPVSMDLIKEAIELSKKTPSACNRQPWRIRIVGDPTKKKIIQKNQNGNRGFGDYIDKFIIITVDTQYYARSRERNQANIDGGMYAMNLIYAFHYYNIATVPLSASLTLAQEKNLRSTFNISLSENFIMFIGIGNYSEEEFKVAKSDRREIISDVF